jgi:hypothetical protein
VGDATDCAKRKCAETRQSTDMIADNRYSKPVKIPARLGVGCKLFARGVAAKVLDLQPNRGARRIGDSRDDRATLGPFRSTIIGIASG